MAEFRYQLHRGEILIRFIVVRRPFPEDPVRRDNEADFLITKKDPPDYGADRIGELSRMMERNNPLDFLVYSPEDLEKRIALGGPFSEAIWKEGRILYG